ncbi:MAG: hypothetical protein Q9219_002353 [cf. Caloplaca sp. 3 TL-2023]
MPVAQNPSQVSGGPSSLEEIETLIQQLYSLPPHRISDIQNSLQQLQRSEQGWQLADALLQSQDEKVRFFGALTFTIKINCDWDTLGDEDRRTILHRLLQWLTLRVNAGEGPLVIRKLCTALVAYFLRPTTTWNRCLLHLVCCLHQGVAVGYEELMSSHTEDTTRLIPNLAKPQLLAALCFAVTIVEEVGKISSTSIQTYKYHERLSSTLDDVVNVLRAALHQEPVLDTRIAEEGIRCFQAWVTYAHGVWIDKVAHLAPLRSLTSNILQLLWHDELCEITADCLGDILTPFSAFFTPKDLDTLVGFLISEQAQNQLAILLGGDFETEPMAIARLLLAYGDAALQDLTKNPDSPSVQIVMVELLRLLTCEGFAGADDDICTPALEFWQSYIEYLIDSLFGAEDQPGPWIEKAKQNVVQAIEHCWVKIRIPPDEILNQWSTDAKGDFKAFRADVEDLLQSSYTLLGANIFDRLASLANEALQNHAWLHLEATLFCLNALSECISDEDVVDATLSKLFGSELFPNMMNPSLFIPSKTQQTTVTTIVSFTAFFERNTSFLPPMLNFLFGSLQVPALAGVAAKAIYSTCDSCRKNLVTEVNAFLNQYKVLLGWQGIESATKEKVIGAVAAIIQALPSDEEKVTSFSQLIDFVSRDVALCQGSTKAGAIEEAQEKGLCALRCLVNMGKSMQEPDDVAIDLEREGSPLGTFDSRLWASSQGKIIRCLSIVGQSLDRDGEVVETSCQVLRTGYKETSPGPFVFPPKTTEAFVLNSNLQTPRLEFVLDTAGAMLTRHMHTQEATVDSTATAFLFHLFKLIVTLGGKTPIQHFSSYIGLNQPDKHTDEPEVSASCIDLGAKYIPHYLHIFLHPQCQDHTANFMRFTIKAMVSEEIMPRRCAAFFWASFFQRYDLAMDVQTMMDSVLEQYGPQVALVIVHGVSGEAARSELETLADPLKKMISAQPKAKQWLSDALFASTFPSSKVENGEKRIFLQQIVSLRGSKKTNQMVKEFWMTCRGTNFAYTS